MFKKKLIMIIITAVIIAMPIIGFAAPDGFTVIKDGTVSVDAMLVQMRLRDLGYLCYRPTGKFGSMSVDAIKRFQANNDFQKDGQVGPTTFDALFQNALDRSGLRNDIVVYGETVDTVSNTGDAISWSVVSSVFQVGMTAKLTDTKTNTSFTIKRVGGENHAYVEPLTSRDTGEFYEMFSYDTETYNFLKSGRLTYEKRPCIIEIDGSRYAASLFGYVHGSDPVFIADPNDPDAEPGEDNEMKGYLSLYFSGSTTDVFNLADSESDANIKISSLQ